MEFTKRELGIILWNLETLPSMDVPMSLEDEAIANRLIDKLRKDKDVKIEYSAVDCGNAARLESEGY